MNFRRCTVHSFALLSTLCATSLARASSHREAPAIAGDPAADNTDLYAWVCDQSGTQSLCIVANYIPLELPEGGPNFHKFSDDVLYQMHITYNDKDGSPSLDDYMTVDVRFKTATTPRVAVDDKAAPPGGGKEFFAQLAGAYDQTADVTVRRRGDDRGERVFQRVKVAPPNIGQRTSTFAYGSPSYETFAKTFVVASDRNYRFFAAPRDDAFYVNLAQVFDLGAFVGLNTFNGQPFRSRTYDVDPSQNGMFASTDPTKAPDGVSGFNVHSIALAIPLSELVLARELPSGHGLRMTYDRLGRLIGITQTVEGRRLFITYDDSDRLAELHLGRTLPMLQAEQLAARYQYDAHGRLAAVFDATGIAQEYGYDDTGRLILERGRAGGAYRMQYDGAGRCVESSGDRGYGLRRLIYEAGRVTRVVDSLGNETLYQCNELGQVERKTLPNGAVYVTRFDDHGRIAAEIGPLGDTVTYEYDARGNLASKHFPNGGVQGYEYDDHHQPTRIVEPDGAVWQKHYERGALVEVIDPTGSTLRYTRNADNDIVGVTTSTGQTLRITTDAAWTEEAISDDLGLVQGRRLDLSLNAVEVWDARGRTGHFAYDRLGRAVEWTRPDETKRSYAYNADDELIRMTDARGSVCTATYSPYGDCLEQTDALGRRHALNRDTERQTRLHSQSFRAGGAFRP